MAEGERLTVILTEGLGVSKESLKEKADTLGWDMSDVARRGVKMMDILSPELIAKIEKVAEGVGLSFGEVVQAWAIRRVAEIDAKKEVSGDPVVMDSLLKTDNGDPVDPEWLYKSLKKNFKKDLTSPKPDSPENEPPEGTEKDDDKWTSPEELEKEIGEERKEKRGE